MHFEQKISKQKEEFFQVESTIEAVFTENQEAENRKNCMQTPIRLMGTKQSSPLV